MSNYAKLCPRMPMKFSEIKPKIKNLGGYKTIAEIKRDGLRVAYNRANDSYWLIEQEFLRPVIKSPRECKSILIKPEELKHKIFMCRKDREELRCSSALRYIEWGEERGFDKRPSCRGRKRWWDVGERRFPPIISPSSVNDLYRAFINEPHVFVDKRLYEIYSQGNFTQLLAMSLNATLTTMFLEIGSRIGLGEGLLDMTVYEVADCLIVNPRQLKKALILNRPIRYIFDEIRQPDRRALDKIIFDALELTADEREAVYEAVSDLVRQRLEKARSV